MAISETKWFPNPTFLGFPNSTFFQFFYFQFKFKFKFELNTFFSSWHYDGKRKIRIMSTLAYKRLKRTLD